MKVAIAFPKRAEFSVGCQLVVMAKNAFAENLYFLRYKPDLNKINGCLVTSSLVE